VALWAGFCVGNVMLLRFCDGMFTLQSFVVAGRSDIVPRKTVIIVQGFDVFGHRYALEGLFQQPSQFVAIGVEVLYNSTCHALFARCLNFVNKKPPLCSVVFNAVR
jgi:hypothetical protein